MGKNNLPGFYIDEYNDDEFIAGHTSKYGEDLTNYLKSLYPTTAKTFLDNIDFDFTGDGQLKTMFYESAIAYLVRRLVVNAEYIYRCNSENRVLTQTKLQDYLQDRTRFSPPQIRQITKYLLGCLDTARDNFSDGMKNFVKKQIRQYDWKCYICGKEMVESNPSTADHLWPRSMGGVSAKFNLRMACQVCNNNLKRDTINYSDFHFEEIAIPVTNYSDFERTLPPKWYAVAIFAKSEYSCSACGQPAYRSGPLTVGRINQDDGWHYLNLTAYCETHNPDINEP